MQKKPHQTRYEIKIVLDQFHRHQIRQWIRLHSSGFEQAYPSRRVNNIYFDSIDLDNLNDHVSGVSERRKLRLRWYGDCFNFQTATLELKQKMNRLGWKDAQPISGSFDLQAMTWDEITTLIKDSSGKGFSQILGSSIPVLINHYQREYYKTAYDDKIRISVDTRLTTCLQKNKYKPNLHFSLPPSGLIILELKCPLAKSAQMPKLLDELPTRPEAFSKYNQAMEYYYYL